MGSIEVALIETKDMVTEGVVMSVAVPEMVVVEVGLIDTMNTTMTDMIIMMATMMMTLTTMKMTSTIPTILVTIVTTGIVAIVMIATTRKPFASTAGTTESESDPNTTTMIIGTTMVKI